jgi:hypothetical protein
VGLRLDVDLAFVPANGTLMVDARVSSPYVDEDAEISCVLHYLTVEGAGLPNKRYLVQPADGPAPFPNETQLTEAEGVSTLPEWASSRKWARSLEVPFEAPNGEGGWADQVSVHAGAWDANYVARKRWETAASLVRSERPGLNEENTGQMRADYWQAKDILREADPFSVLDPDPADDGQQSRLQKVLRTGRFEVRGQVYLDPKAPLQPEPRMPESGPDADDRLIAREEIRFEYP